MSLWGRLRDLFGGEGGTEEERSPAMTPAEAGDPTTAAPSARERLEAMADGRSSFDEESALACVEALRGGVDEGAGLDAAVRLVARRPEARALVLASAELRSERGDDEGARAMLRETVGDPAAPVRALVVAAALAERLGRETEARRLYERILAREAGRSEARAGLRRLDGGQARRAPAGGATLMDAASLAPARYRVEAEVGRGGAGTVFVAVDLRLGRRVALKVYHRRGGILDPRLRAEAATAAGLEHPGVVRILDLDEALGAIAMEWIEGGALRARIAAADATVAEACRWAASAAEALAFVHARGVVHRDLKPSNILLRGDGRAVLTDFGLALPVGQEPATAGIVGQGTLRYMPPEQRDGRPADPASDVYALGVTLGELWAAVGEGVPEKARELTASCTRSDPTARPRLEDLLDGLGRARGMA